MMWLVQNCRSIKCLQFLKPPELRREGALPPWAPTRALPTTSWGTLSGPQSPRLLMPPLTTNPGSAPGDLRQVGGFRQVLHFPPPIKLTATI